MPRIRTIKPIFWDDDRVNNTPLQALTLFIGMKNFCDDKGIIAANDKLIKAKVFPQRDDVRLKDISQWITDLQENSLLVPFVFDNKSYYALDFSEEKIDKPQPSILPENALQECSRIFLPPQNDSRTFENIPAGEEEDKERKGIGKEEDISAPAVPPTAPKKMLTEEKKAVGKKMTGLPTLDEAKKYFFSVAGDPKRRKSWPEDKCYGAALKFFDHYQANGWVQGKGKPIKDWQAAARNWMRNDVEGTFSARQAPASAPGPPIVIQPDPAKLKPDKTALELDYLYGRFLENQCTVISIDTLHYDYLKKSGSISFSEEMKADIRKKAIEEKPESIADEQVLNRFMKKFGVLQFFEQMKQLGKEVLIETVE